MTIRKRAKRIISTLLIGSGVLLSALAIYNMTLAETISATKQQTAAEAEPLAFPDQPLGQSLTKVGQIFAKIYVPRFGENYVRNIAQGTSVEKVLNTVGIGHYVNTQMPGEVGNFAIAGHRAGNGGHMRSIDKLRSGDMAYVETSTHMFTYKFIESKVVSPESIGVIAPVPEGLNGAVATASYLTMTTCTPIYINTERYVAWFELVDSKPIR